MYAIPLRLIVGFGFMQHGYGKLARGPEDFIDVLHAMGIPADFLLGWPSRSNPDRGTLLMAFKIRDRRDEDVLSMRTIQLTRRRPGPRSTNPSEA